MSAVNALQALSMIPGIGDIIGPVADAAMYYDDPESRTLGNYGLSVLGVLPFMPAAGTIRAFDSDALAIASPSGNMSKAGLKRAQERVRQHLFGEGLERAGPIIRPEKEALMQQAKELRELAERGMKPRAYKKKAEELEALAASMP